MSHTKIIATYMTKPFSIVVALLAQTKGIGFSGKLPWGSLAVDMKYFQQLTTSNGYNAVIMGRKTWDSIPKRNRPLPNRLNIVISNYPDMFNIEPETMICTSFQSALDAASSAEKVQSIFVIGGGEIYKIAIAHPLCDHLYVTEINGLVAQCDTHFPLITEDWIMSKKGENVYTQTTTNHNDNIAVVLNFNEYTRRDIFENKNKPYRLPYEPCNYHSHFHQQKHQEHQYLNLVSDIIQNGAKRIDRTKIGTLSIFGAQMRFSLRENTFPLLTTKRVPWRAVAQELLWFIRGCTNAKELSKKKVYIWDGNASREFLDQNGLSHREVGDLGPIYGFQWRHFGAKYIDMHTDYTGQGIDQLQICINTIKTNPNDRRIIMSAWNPSDLSMMALPPCHMFCQFYVSNGELSCHMYQRSADMGLGVPFNIASYALLTHMIANVCNLKAGDFIHSIGDAHVYLSHIETLKTQLSRTPKQFPRIHLTPNITNIDNFTMNDIHIIGYDPHDALPMTMAI